MPRRKYRRKRFNFVRVYFAPTAALLLWLAVCVVAWISVSELAHERSLKHHPHAKATASPPARAEAHDPPHLDGRGDARAVTPPVVEKVSQTAPMQGPHQGVKSSGSRRPSGSDNEDETREIGSRRLATSGQAPDGVADPPGQPTQANRENDERTVNAHAAESRSRPTKTQSPRQRAVPDVVRTPLGLKEDDDESDDLAQNPAGTRERSAPAERPVPEAAMTASAASSQTPADEPAAAGNHPQSRPSVGTAQTNEQPQANAGAAAKQPDEPPTGVAPARPAASPHLARAQFTSGVVHREPVDRVTRVFHTENKQLRYLYYFTEISGLRGETVTHNWWHDGQLMAQVSSHVRGQSWRMYSGKRLTSDLTGPWRVVVTDSQGETLIAADIVYKTP